MIDTESFRSAKSAAALDDDIRTEKNGAGADVYVFDPYNPLNREITQPEVEAILRRYGVTAPITNFNLYRRAFVNRSYTKRPSLENETNNIVIAPKPDDCLPLYSKSNERLEFVGDGVLECITKYYLYTRFPKENEGFMTEKKIALVKNESIGKLAYEMGLQRWVVLSRHAESKNTRTSLKKLGCLFEAFLGALFLDCNKIAVADEAGWFANAFSTGPGFQMAQVFLENVFETHVNWIDLIRNDDNYKNILQVKIQKEFKTTPTYIEIEPFSATNGYHMGVYICLGQPVHTANPLNAVAITSFAGFADVHAHMSRHGRVLVFLGEGSHKTKKVAEQQSCMMAIDRIAALTQPAKSR